eukprot:1963848-Karenia_brevis.AAC.1
MATLRCLNFVGRVCRLELQCGHPLVQPFTVPTKGHQVMPKSPVSMAIMAHWEHLAQSNNIFVASVALANLCLLFGVLRFAHLQRSCLLRTCSQ